jgi:Yip1-like protein
MFLSRFVSIFVSPTKVFDDIRDAKVGWWQPWLMVSVLFVIGSFLMIPANQAVMALKMTPEMIERAKPFTYLPLFIMPAMLLIVALLASGVSYPVVTMQSKEATYKKFFTLVLFSNLIFSLGYLITAIMVRAKGVDSIQSPEDLRLSFSLRMLALDASPVVRGLLGSIEFFSLWGLALVVVGLKRMFNLRTGQAIACVIPMWIIYVILSIVGEFSPSMGG